MRQNHWTHIRGWEFRAMPRSRKRFERTYGVGGEWVRLLRKAKGFLGTELLRADVESGTYLTVDYWISKSPYETFRLKFDREFRILDIECESLTALEVPLGSCSSALSGGSEE